MSPKVGVALLIVVALTGLGCGSGSSTPPPPPPPPSNEVRINSLSPASASQGSPDLVVTITGSNFKNEAHFVSKAVWSVNGVDTLLSTTFVSTTQLTAVVPAALLSVPVIAQVLLETGDFMGSLPLSKSNAVTFDVVAPPLGAVSINSISPVMAPAGSPDLTLTVSGANFVAANRDNSVVAWSVNGSYKTLATTFVSKTQLTAVIPAAFLTTPATASVWVQIFHFADSVPAKESNKVQFTITAPSSPSISPSSETLGPNGVRQFVFTLTGGEDVTWAIQEGQVGGIVTPTGLYTAPDHIGTFHVVAASKAGSTKSATATISVVDSGFTPTGNMHSPRSGHTATLLQNGKVLIAGGGDNSAEIFDPGNGTFTLTGSMTTTRFGSTATLLSDGRVLFTGGFGIGLTELPRLDSAELYDPQSGSFASTGKMVQARVAHTCTLLNDGRVLITGGTEHGGGGGAAMQSAEIYDPKSGFFTSAGSMNSARANHTATLLPHGDVLIAGGWNGHAADFPDDPPWDPLFAELFDAVSGGFKGSGSMSTTRSRHTAIRLLDGKVLLLGGIANFQNLHSQPQDPAYAEIYDPDTQLFSRVNLTISRTRHTVTLLKDGRLLIVGGDDQGHTVSTVEMFDLAAGNLSVAGGLATARKGHVATRLVDGRVLITGGVDSNGNVLASAEVFK
jgi:hypothetical protein